MEMFDRYNNEIKFASVVSSIDFPQSGTSDFDIGQVPYSVVWGGVFCYEQSYPSDSLGISVRASSPEDVVTFESSAVANRIEFVFSSQNLRNTTSLMLKGTTGMYSKRVCGTLQVRYRHYGGTPGCSIRLGDVETLFQTTTVYSTQNHINGSPFSLNISPGRLMLVSLNMCLKLSSAYLL